MIQRKDSFCRLLAVVNLFLQRWATEWDLQMATDWEQL